MVRCLGQRKKYARFIRMYKVRRGQTPMIKVVVGFCDKQARTETLCKRFSASHPLKALRSKRRYLFRSDILMNGDGVSSAPPGDLPIRTSTLCSLIWWAKRNRKFCHRTNPSLHGTKTCHVTIISSRLNGSWATQEFAVFIVKIHPFCPYFGKRFYLEAETS